MPDTIAAIATGSAPGGVGIVRVSGAGAFGIAEKIFRPKKKGLDWGNIRGYTMAYGEVAGIDEAICLLFRGPGSYTGEDVAELQCHGGPLLLGQVLQAALDAGARMAGPGEFTRRAWLSGRIGLNQAEAVTRLVNAQSEQALRAAHGAMGGALSERIAGVRGRLTALAAHIAAWADYPEEDIEPLRDCEAEAVLREAEEALAGLIEGSRGARAVLEGVSAALVGRPNVGKSSLLNRMAGFERAIVTAMPGTTRDTVTETVRLGNLTLRLTDTAGMRETEHPVERAGVERSVAAMKGADLILVVVDAVEGVTHEDEGLLKECDKERTILIYNKIDCHWLPPGLRAIPPHGGGQGGLGGDGCVKHIVYTSALTGEGMEELARAAEEICRTAGFAPGEAMLTTQRQAQCAAEALEAVREGLRAVEEGFAPDAVSVCVEDAVQALLALTGERASDAVVEEVFKGFCVGK